MGIRSGALYPLRLMGFRVLGFWGFGDLGVWGFRGLGFSALGV